MVQRHPFQRNHIAQLQFDRWAAIVLTYLRVCQSLSVLVALVVNASVLLILLGSLVRCSKTSVMFATFYVLRTQPFWISTIFAMSYVLAAGRRSWHGS